MKFVPINQPYLYGKEAKLPCGLTVEVVRVDSEGGWDVFLVNDQKSVVACSVEQYRQYGHANVPYKEAMRIAKSLLVKAR